MPDYFVEAIRADAAGDETPVAQPLSAEDRLAGWMIDHIPEYHRWMMTGWRDTMRDEAVVLARQMLDAARSVPDNAALRERIETNLRHAERRPDDDFYRGKASAFRVVLSMLDGPPNPTFVCGRPDRD